MTKKDPVSISPTMVEYIHKASKSGMTHSQISEKLISVGHKEHVIKLHFKHVKKKERRKYGWVGMVAVLLIIIIVFLFSVIDEGPCNNYTDELDIQGCRLNEAYKEKVGQDIFDLTWEVAYDSIAEKCIGLEGFALDACIDASTTDISVKYCDTLSDDYDSKACGCNLLKTDYWKEVCYGSFYDQMASRFNDSAYCMEIILPAGAWKSCLEGLA